MRILVAGASGVVGRHLVPALLARDHQVLGLCRSLEGKQLVEQMGGIGFVADALDPRAVDAAFESFRPEAVVHQLTAIAKDADLSRFASAFEQTNRLRTTGLDHLVAAARRAGVGRFVAQSFCGWPFARIGGPVKTESDPLDPQPPKAFRSTLGALQHVESTMRSASDLRGVALRYGAFYGSGTAIGRDGALVDRVRRRLMPVVGDGAAVWSFVHMADVASATVTAVEGSATGIFQVVDDDPAPVQEWLPALAAAAGARRPWRLPAWLGRLLLPEHVYILMTSLRGASNRKFKETFDWRPAWPSWRQGFAEALS